MNRRFIVTRVVKNKKILPRYQRSGYVAFDTEMPLANHQFFATKKEAKELCTKLNERKRT